MVNDIFRDSQGRTGDQLPLFGNLITIYPGCPTEIVGGGTGQSYSPYDCPGQYTSGTTTYTLAGAAPFLNALDRKWYQPCRLVNTTLMNVGGRMCPQMTCVTDGTGTGYEPYLGLIFDLGGPSNKVAVFAENDHGPQPCESLEYTVYLSDNPRATAKIDHPATQGVDPQKWNRAVLSKIYTQGFVAIRPPDPTNAMGKASCGDTVNYSVEEDSFVQVFSLPCGITFRFASILAGNDGLDFPACAYNSSEGEIDAVAGLTEGGAAVCPDNDGDHFVDCNCPGHPSVCDCNDNDPTIHPGASEPCGGADKNCDGMSGVCAADHVCHGGECLVHCTGSGEFNQFCPTGATCQDTSDGRLCVPTDCTNGACPQGATCDSATHRCTPDCAVIHCPPGQQCFQGTCLDLCQNLQCPPGQTCFEGNCVFPCTCFNADSGCPQNDSCDRSGTMQCVPSACVGVSCGTGEHCSSRENGNGQCVSFCADVTCPPDQKCDEASGGCIDACSGVTCTDPQVCNPPDGKCVDKECVGVTCSASTHCQAGVCVGNPVDMGAHDGGTSRARDRAGCSCDLGGRGSSATPLATLILVLMFGIRLRRRHG